MKNFGIIFVSSNRKTLRFLIPLLAVIGFVTGANTSYPFELSLAFGMTGAIVGFIISLWAIFK